MARPDSTATAVADELATLIAERAAHKASVGSIARITTPLVIVPTHAFRADAWHVWVLKHSAFMGVRLTRTDGSTLYVNLKRGPNYVPPEWDGESAFLVPHAKRDGVRIHKPGEAYRIDSDMRRALADRMVMIRTPSKELLGSESDECTELARYVDMLDGPPKQYAIKKHKAYLWAVERAKGEGADGGTLEAKTTYFAGSEQIG